ncbi:hypothetical protein [Altericista sp. CCNU0014]|uniref:hypothetical protein n=1 Tax=Altericista sp. CCNU0014 TaxID=3082949 RepID=UPI00384D3D66
MQERNPFSLETKLGDRLVCPLALLGVKLSVAFGIANIGGGWQRKLLHHAIVFRKGMMPV